LKFLSTLITQIKDFFDSLTPIKRMSLIASAGVLLAAVFVIGWMATGTEYVALQTNIPEEQVPTLLNILRGKNIPYRMEDSGKSIHIPRSFLHSTQMTIMTEVGAGRMGEIGLELFDKQDFGTTSYAQRVNFQRALQGELQRAINSLTAVNRSKIILALPKKKTFLEEGSQATASVVLELHSGKRLSEDQVLGIGYLVANSVEGLDFGQVSVVNSHGQILSKKYDSSVAGSAQLIDIKKKVENSFEESIETILSRVVGEGKVIAKVNADLNTRQVSQIEEVIDPDRSAIRSIQTEEESVNGNRSNPTGVPGARANLPGADQAGRVNFNQDVKRELKTTNFEVQKTKRNVTESAGSVKKITVAVMVDGIYKNVENAEGEKTTQWVPREEEEINRFRILVQNAIGFDEKRGDSISIESFQFQKEDFAETDKQMQNLHREKMIRFLASWAMAGFGLVLLFIFFIRPFIRWVTDSFHDSVEDMLPKTIEELEQLHGLEESLPGMGAAMPMLEESIDPEKAESEILKERIMNLMEEDEEKASGAFSLWLVRRDF